MKKVICISVPEHSYTLDSSSVTIGKIYDVIGVEYRKGVPYSLSIKDNNLNTVFYEDFEGSLSGWTFTNGTEKKLEDVLKKLPGVEIDSNGEIEVEGKKVQKVLVEGKEFFDGDSKVATQNIPASAIDKVQVLKNYNEVSSMKGVTNNEDNIAINIKLKEGKKSVLEGVPKSLPALVKASRIQDKVKGVGFDWEEPHQVWDKVQEEIEEFQVEVAAGDQDKMESEFGDVLFSMINYARFLNINPEDALERTNKKFIKRFQYLESKAQELGKPLMEMTLAEMDIFWEEAKKM